MTTPDPLGPSSGQTCLGFEVRSELPFQLLRPAAGRPLDVVEHDGAEPRVATSPLMSWEARPGNPFDRRIYRHDGGFAVWQEGVGWFLVDPSAPSIAVPPSDDPLRREERTWALPAALCVSESDDLAVHGASVEVEGSAVLFCAPGHFGKTTLSASFVRAGHRLLADDMTCCRLEPVPSALPGPAVLRLRRDVYRRLAFPGLEPVSEDEEKVHLMVGAHDRGTGDPVPIRAIVFVRDASLRSAEDRPDLTRVSATDALQNLWTVTFSLPTAEAREQTFRKAALLADRVDLWEMYRPADFDALPATVERVIEACLSDR